MDYEPAIAAFATFFVAIDPVSMAPLFLGLTATHPAAERRVIAVKGVLIATGILLVFALAGNAILGWLGITLPAFRIAGGILLLLLSVDMVLARRSGLRSTTPSEDEEADHRPDVTVFPLAIPHIAGPGAIASALLLTAEAGPALVDKAVVLGPMLAVLLLTLIALLAAGSIGRLLGLTGVNVISRIAGVILAALAVQFILDGLVTALHL